jgi:tetratricopeptide (TPR) repeat protein
MSSPPLRASTGRPRGLPRPSRLHLLLLLALVLGGVAWAANAYWLRLRAQRLFLEQQLARAQAEQHRRATELAAAEDAVRRNPEDYTARFRLAEKLFHAEQHDRALAELAELERRRPAEWEPPFRRSVVLNSLGRYSAAIEAARRARRLRPADPVLREWLAGLYLSDGRAREALALYEEALQESPDSYNALLGRARSLEQLVRYHHPVSFDDMVETARRAVALRPAEPSGLLTLARMLFVFQKRPEEAARVAEKAAAVSTDGSAGPYILLAEIALSLPPTPENLRRAGEAAYQAGLRDPRHPLPPNHIGRVYLAQGDIPRAIAALERSARLGATPETVSQLAVAYRRAGDVARADRFAAEYRRYTERVNKRDSLLRERALRLRDPEPCARLAELYLEGSQPAIAEKWLAAAVELGLPQARRRALEARLRQPAPAAAEGTADVPRLALQ